MMVVLMLLIYLPGHGGTAAADYVQANLHKKIISQSYFKTDPERAIREVRIT